MTSVREAGERIEELLDDLSLSVPPATMEKVSELLRAVMALYGDGLARILDLVPERLRDLAGDEVVASLLVLHDLHPDDLATRVQAALDRVRPYLGSHAGGVSIASIEEGVVRLRLEGSCDGCPSSAVTVRGAVEGAILAAAPDVVAVETEGIVESAGPALLQIGRYRPEDCPVPSTSGASTSGAGG